MKYGLKFSVLLIIIKRKKTYKEMSFVEVKEKKEMLKKEKKIFSKQFVTTNELWFKKENFLMDVFH